MVKTRLREEVKWSCSLRRTASHSWVHQGLPVLCSYWNIFFKLSVVCNLTEQILRSGWSNPQSGKQQKWGERKFGCVPEHKWSNTVAALQCPASKPISPSCIVMECKRSWQKIAWKTINRSFRSHCLQHQHVKLVVCYLCPTYEQFMLGWRVSPLSKMLWSSFLPPLPLTLGSTETCRTEVSTLQPWVPGWNNVKSFVLLVTLGKYV